VEYSKKGLYITATNNSVRENLARQVGELELDIFCVSSQTYMANRMDTCNPSRNVYFDNEINKLKFHLSSIANTQVERFLKISYQNFLWSAKAWCTVMLQKPALDEQWWDLEAELDHLHSNLQKVG
jgi:hypothetical protein